MQKPVIDTARTVYVSLNECQSSDVHPSGEEWYQTMNIHFRRWVNINFYCQWTMMLFLEPYTTLATSNNTGSKMEYSPLFLKYILLIKLLQLSQFPPFSPSTWYPHSLQQSPFSSCPWGMHMTNLTSPFPILFLISPHPFCTYEFCFLIPAPFLHSLPSPSQSIAFQTISISVILFLFCLFA